jgi:tRNA pseudouridine38-40 synthase
VRRITAVAVRRNGARVEIEVSANAFLHHMVRNIAGTLLAAGVGDRPAAWVAEVLASRDRACAGPMAVARGLYFAGVDYAACYGLPSAPASFR